MVNSGYNFVLIIVGWEIELGGIWNYIVVCYEIGELIFD